MDNKDLEVSIPEVFSDPKIGDEPAMDCSMDTFFDEIFNGTHACTHTHTCNPPGPDLSHTHTCFHVHTKFLSAPTDETAESCEKHSAKKKPHGNREAVRKYREKKKARTASLEDEVVRLQALNQQLVKRLQGQAALEAEVGRLRCLLVDIRGRIEGEIGSFPYQKQAKAGGHLVSDMAQANLIGGARVVNACNLRCDDQIYCLQPGMQGGENGAFNGQGLGACGIGNIQCMGNSGSGPKEDFGCGLGHATPSKCTSDAGKTNGACVEPER